ncbi:lysophospholipid acyltransferase family protein [Chelativorans sp. AA-79]|uniref:lysophospholipid acyltransferase family protein n=1 Tax=Chelativorans sp. AA-79 TaxID=3028735 RepID=UPI0023FA39DF|nr:lysophospholipid acyltransferase family protein [Chelativorans sp. AA-79]WEX08423.1 lysophospholipid acyltransferase family protein [Chelativorans sp. AA-79]
MAQRAVARSMAVKKRRQERPLKSLWRRIRKPLAQSRFVKNMLASGMAIALRIVERTNPRVEGSQDVDARFAEIGPAIVALWHGQHLLAPAIKPRRHPLVALFSKSADAELNALVAEKMDIKAVRGSGGREGKARLKKGGAAALIQLKRAIEAGSNVAMIADIPHGTPREAGLGIVTLARLSGRPVVPMAIATSRRKVLERTWDKTTINLPFGRCAVVMADPILVAADADDEEMEAKRRQLTDALNRVTRDAYRLVDGHPPYPDRDGR